MKAASSLFGLSLNRVCLKHEALEMILQSLSMFGSMIQTLMKSSVTTKILKHNNSNTPELWILQFIRKKTNYRLDIFNTTWSSDISKKIYLWFVVPSRYSCTSPLSHSFSGALARTVCSVSLTLMSLSYGRLFSEWRTDCSPLRRWVQVNCHGGVWLRVMPVQLWQRNHTEDPAAH